MAKPIIVELRDTGARKGRVGLVKNVPYGLIFGEGDREGGNCGDLLGYMFDGAADEFNPEGYNNNEIAFADQWRQHYEQSKVDVNKDVALMALNKGNGPVPLSLEEKVTVYITDGDDSILKADAVEKDGREEKYESIDLVIEDTSTGGYRM